MGVVKRLCWGDEFLEFRFRFGVDGVVEYLLNFGFILFVRKEFEVFDLMMGLMVGLIVNFLVFLKVLGVFIFVLVGLWVVDCDVVLFLLLFWDDVIGVLVIGMFFVG